MADYKEFLNSLNRDAYHEGEYSWEEDGYTVTRTYHWSAPGCHNSCGLLLYTKEGKLERVEGDPLSPFVSGKLCMRCLDLPEAVNHPDRLKYPMKRTGERGENKWTRISWDEAFDIIVEKVNYIKANYGGSAILSVTGTGRNKQWQVPYLASCGFDTHNQGTFGFTGFACYLPRLYGAFGPIGDFPIVDASVAHPDRYANKEWQTPGVVVIWGNEPLKSNADGYIGHWLVQCVQHGTKIISIDPRLTWWGARADYFLRIRPGTDAALACAWLNIIISEGLYDQEFVDSWCGRFDELANSVKDTTPEWAAEITGCSVDDIIGSARLYADGAGGASAIQWGLAMDQQMSAMALNLACCDLMAITGNLDVPGGNILMRYSFGLGRAGTQGTEFISPESKEKMLTQSYVFGIPGAHFINDASSDAELYAIETGKPYPIQMMWIQSSNAISCPGMDAPRLYEALKKIPFIVNADPFLTPTSVACADILLPVAMSCERYSTRCWWTPLRAISKVSEYYEAKSDEWICLNLGKRLNPDLFPWDDEADIVAWVFSKAQYNAEVKREGKSDRDWRREFLDFVEKGDLPNDYSGHMQECHYPGVAYDDWNATYKKYEKGMLRKDGNVGFATPSGRCELAPIAYELWGLTPYPFHTEPLQSPISTPELFKEYPLILTCGGRSYEFFHSEHRQLPTMREFHPQPLVTINPSDAEKYGIEDGEWVWIESDHGRFRQKSLVSPIVPEGVVHAEHGWWFPEQEGAEPNLFGTFDSNCNNLTRAFETGEGGIGTSIKSMLCRIYPYTSGDVLPGLQVTRLGGFNEIIPGQA